MDNLFYKNAIYVGANMPLGVHIQIQVNITVFDRYMQITAGIIYYLPV